MITIYTTEQLVEILARECRETAKGNRLALSGGSLSPGALRSAQIFGEDTARSFDSYWQMRSSVHAYQVEHQVSGLVIESVALGDQVCRFPSQAEQLILIDGDMEILSAAFPRVVEAFIDYCRSTLSFISHKLELGKQHIVQDLPLTIDAVIDITNSGLWEWAELCKTDEGIDLCIGWGEPALAPYIDHENDELIISADRICRIN